MVASNEPADSNDSRFCSLAIIFKDFALMLRTMEKICTFVTWGGKNRTD